jgi:uncharacterized protein
VDGPAGEVSIAFDGPLRSDVFLVLGHGAGADMSGDFMTTVAQGIARSGMLVCRFNFPYAERGRKAPDPQPKLESTFAAVVEAAREHAGTERVVLGGKSMGGRIAALVAPRLQPEGLVFLGYPLHPPGRPERLRSDAIAGAGAPMLFVEGTRDPFCPLGTLRTVLEESRVQAEVVEIPDGDHSFRVRRSSGRSTEDSWSEVVRAVTRWIERTIA